MPRSPTPGPVIKTRPGGRARPGAAGREDRETRAHPGDHHALRLWLRLLTCTLLIERHVRSRLRARYATTLPRFDLLSQLERHPEGLKMNELSRRMMVTGGNVTGIVDQLAKERLVERLPEAGDRRALRVRLTRSGEKAFADMAREHEAWIAAILADLTRREHQELFALLAKVKRHALATTDAGAPA
ncbi:MAG TPA: MarR family transcriptional regulator [Burkholderiales bacterium]|nr:MarR family transcriptional regulator [Burkholderiales bacterium]